MSGLIPWLQRRQDLFKEMMGDKKAWELSFPDFELFGDKFFSEQWPAVDVSEDNEKVYVKTEVPGVSAENIDISHENGVLTIKGEKKDEFEEKKKHSYYRESKYGSFSRSVPLGNHLDWDSVQAVCKDGLLTLTIPKVETKKASQIKIQVD